MLVYMNFNSFDFLVFDNVDFLNYFANEHIRWVVLKQKLAVLALSDTRLSPRACSISDKALMPVF
jgi:hypothetical protein